MFPGGQATLILAIQVAGISITLHKHEDRADWVDALQKDLAPSKETVIKQ